MYNTSAFGPKDSVEHIKIQLGRRYRQCRAILNTEGPKGVTARLRIAATRSLSPKDTVMPVQPADVLAVDLSHPFRPEVPTAPPGRPVIANWITTPPSRGSGGHTTLFRIIRYLETHGYHNRVYFYDVYRADQRYYESIVHEYYGFHGQVADVTEGMEDAHAVIATSWQTAYPVFSSRCTGKRFYFVQDFEPYFYPAGSYSLLAENTYRMGFHAITAGRWLAQKLRAEFGMEADAFDFGCDTTQYYRFETDRAKRTGVVFYARPEAARRGFELGLLALELFARRNPGIEIHFYGEKIPDLRFRATNHGRTPPEKLNRIYNQCYAGLSLSLTNVSLVPHEMLAAGCVPVVNDAAHNRIVLDNPFVRYVAPSPAALAAELEALVTNVDFESLSRTAAASVRAASWDEAGATVDAIFRRALETRAQAKTA
jgi:hypothetical protein